MKRANIITAILMLIFAGYVFIDSIRMEYLTVDKVPGPGFIPLWIAVLIAVIALLILIYNLALNRPDTDKNPSFDRKFLFNTLKVIGGSALSMMLVKPLGMLVSIGLLTGFLAWSMGTKGWKTNLLLSILTPVFFYLIFQQGLEVNFPKGLFGF
ncbi:MAG TPA: tripartite tricarboxylate transporter TctB family protein [Verrucomicrobiae bacterium]|nr:tripartite tricarboxylate transporter TctB family protein [Verrucomicrobiae bacterium]